MRTSSTKPEAFILSLTPRRAVLTVISVTQSSCAIALLDWPVTILRSVTRNVTSAVVGVPI